MGTWTFWLNNAFDEIEITCIPRPRARHHHLRYTITATKHFPLLQFGVADVAGPKIPDKYYTEHHNKQCSGAKPGFFVPATSAFYGNCAASDRGLGLVGSNCNKAKYATVKDCQNICSSVSACSGFEYAPPYCNFRAGALKYASKSKISCYERTEGPKGEGGLVTNAKGKVVHIFKSSGTFKLSSPGKVTVLVVAGGGGGGGGGSHGGGGGAGGFKTSSVDLKAGSYAVVVGAGGTHGKCGHPKPTNGGDSKFGDITSHGGGSGDADSQSCRKGGSGGGGHAEGGGYQGCAGMPGEGNRGGDGTRCGSGNRGAGGGGGAGGAGQAGTGDGCGSGQPSKGGDGGAGKASDITGKSVMYAGGGGGGAGDSKGTGGKGQAGGGHGSNGSSKAATDAKPNTGSGGGVCCSSAAVGQDWVLLVYQDQLVWPRL